MENNVRRMEVLVLEDEPSERQALIEKIDACTEHLHLAFATDNADDALTSISGFCPDAVILDLELHKGYGDGFEFLTKLKQLKLQKPPFILVTTWNISPTTHKAARDLGADYVLTKTTKGYSEQTPVDFLVSLRSVIFSRAPRPDDTAVMDDSEKEKQVRRRIMAELNKVGVNPKSKGYGYLIDAIEMIMVENRHHICQEVGKKWKKAENSVERAIQNAINRAWNTADPQDLLDNYTAYIKSERGVPTITEFIYYYAQKIKPDFE